MNERIRELAEQAGFKLIDIRDQFDYNEDSPIKKFAELIVRECIVVIEDSEGYSQYFPHVAKNIETHFGVEE